MAARGHGAVRPGAGVGGGARLLIAGASGSGKLRLAQAIAAATGSRQLLVVESAFLPADPTRLIRLRAALGAEPDQPLTMEMLRRSVIKELRANGAVVAERR